MSSQRDRTLITPIRISWTRKALAALLFAVVHLGLPARAQSVRLDVTRDLWVSSVDREVDGNNGGAPRLKVKSFQEMSMIDIDPAPLRGRVVKSATLHVRNVGGPPLKRITVSSLGAPWVEGTGTSYAQEAGRSTFRSRIHPNTPWTLDGGDLCRVMLAQGGTLWGMADATAPDSQGWQAIAVDPAVVAARVAGVSEGFLIFDDTGTEWTRKGEKFTVNHMPNRFIYSREQNRASAPYMTVMLGPVDRTPPAAVGELRAEPSESLPAGEAAVSWTTPSDRGPAGTIGFLVDVDAKPAPRSMIPLPGAPGARVTMALRDLALTSGADVDVAVRAVDGAGNIGPRTSTAVLVSSRQPKPFPATGPARENPPLATLPKLGAAEIAVIDELDKVEPATGRMIPSQPEGYLASNHLWSAADRTIRLAAAKNEFVAFQVLVSGDAGRVTPSLAFKEPSPARITAAFGHYYPVRAKSGLLPDPIVPLGGLEDVVDTGPRQSLHVELYVPHVAVAGRHEATLTLRAGGESLELPVSLQVWDFALPDHLSFIPEMNCYGLPANERDYYRLAHRHRTVLNRVPYSQSGEVAEGCAPRWNGRTFDWTGYDHRFGPLLDGSAFVDLPRKGVPLEIFYLPLHENWPTPIEPNYNGDPWADRAFKPAYRRAFVEASRQFTAHADARGWNETMLMCFFNGKYDFKTRGWSRGSSPWLLDEPSSFSDFWALRYFGAAFHEGVHTARAGSATEPPGRAKLVFRCDISRPEWQRDALDGLLDYNVVGGAMRTYNRIVMDRKAAQGQVVLEYSSANPIEESNVHAVGWSIDAWTLGVDGVLPWQTVGRGDSWREADPLSLFYPGYRDHAPVPSVRLKAYRRGQQDVEYLTLLTRVSAEPRWAVARRVREALRLAGERGGSGRPASEDAGMIRFRSLRPQDLAQLRTRVGQALSDAHPAPQSRLVEFRTPPRDPSTLTPRMARP